MKSENTSLMTLFYIQSSIEESDTFRPKAFGADLYSMYYGSITT